MGGRVKQELQQLVKEGILEPIQCAGWVAPIVSMLKNNGSVRVCGDLKVTVSQVACVDRYPIPSVKDLLSKLAGGQHFTKLVQDRTTNS